jgi:hypothetical protein
MTRILMLLAACGPFALSLPKADDAKFSFVDLRSHANQKLDDSLAKEGNSFAQLKRNEQELEGVTFKIADAYIQLGSKVMQPVERKTKPDKVEGIKVDSTFSKLHILHATEYGTGNATPAGGMDGGPLYIADDTKIAEYMLHYADGTTETIPVVYGKDVRDWWFNEKSKGVSRGKVAWKSVNGLTKAMNWQIRLYATAWKNPHPEKKVSSIDYSKAGDSPAAPFCIAITMEK